jgi:hypothetical protein
MTPEQQRELEALVERIRQSLGATREDMEMLEDRCRVCDRLLGIGVRFLHLGYCEDHWPEPDDGSREGWEKDSDPC